MYRSENCADSINRGLQNSADPGKLVVFVDRYADLTCVFASRPTLVRTILNCRRGRGFTSIVGRFECPTKNYVTTALMKHDRVVYVSFLRLEL